MTTTLKAPPAGGAFLLGPTDPADVFTPERFTPEQLAARDAIATFVTREAAPRTERIAAKDYEASRELLAILGRDGYVGIDVPRGLRRPRPGPRDLDRGHRALSAAIDFSVTYSAHSGIGTLPTVYFGTEAQKQRYLPGLAAGDDRGRLLPDRARLGLATRRPSRRAPRACPTARSASTARSSSSPTPASPTSSRLRQGGRRAASRPSSSSARARALASGPRSTRWACTARRPGQLLLEDVVVPAGRTCSARSARATRSPSTSSTSAASSWAPRRSAACGRAIAIGLEYAKGRGQPSAGRSSSSAARGGQARRHGRAHVRRRVAGLPHGRDDRRTPARRRGRRGPARPPAPRSRSTPSSARSPRSSASEALD